MPHRVTGKRRTAATRRLPASAIRAAQRTGIVAAASIGVCRADGVGAAALMRASETAAAGPATGAGRASGLC